MSSGLAQAAFLSLRSTVARLFLIVGSGLALSTVKRTFPHISKGSTIFAHMAKDGMCRPVSGFLPGPRPGDY